MPQFYFTSKRRIKKRWKKERRHQIVRMVQYFTDMREVFAQLTLVDSARIERRANREIAKHGLPEVDFGFRVPVMWPVNHRLHLCYKYAKEITRTILV